MLDAYKLISGISSPKGGSQTMASRINGRHTLNVYGALLELISRIKKTEGGSQTMVTEYATDACWMLTGHH